MASPAPAPFDDVLLSIATRHSDIKGLLHTFFSFLHRRTDFYVEDSDPSRKLGFGPGVAEALVSH